MKDVFLFIFCFMSIFGPCLASDPTEEDSKAPHFQTVPLQTAAYDALEALLADELHEDSILREKLSAALIKIFFQGNILEQCNALALALHKVRESLETQADILDRITFRK